MKIAAIKLGARIAPGGTSGGSGEALAILDMLAYNNEVHAYTKVLSKDAAIKNITMHQIIDEYTTINDENYDALVVINGAVNYFGGVDSPDQTLNYYLINNFKGKVFYILCDPSLTLKQIWPSVAKKEWSANYTQSDIDIVRTDIEYISQPKDVNRILQDIAKNKIMVSNISHYPFEQFPMIQEKTKWLSLDERKYDILYGGTFRSGKRQDDMIKFYFDYDDLNVTMFGKISEKDFTEKKVANKTFPNFEGAINYDKFNEKMSLAVSTVIIGDKYYKEIDDLAQRIYESINAGVITFIDSDYDRNKRVYKNEMLQKFLYVDSKEDVVKRLDIIKSMTADQFDSLLKLQYEDVKLDIEKYKLDFSNLLSSKLV